MADIGQEFLQAALDMVSPLIAVASEPDSLLVLVSLAGWDLAGAGVGFDVNQFAAAVGTLASDLAAVETAVAGSPDVASLAGLLPGISDAVRKLTSFPANWTPPQGLPADLAETMIEDILGQLLVLYLGGRPVLRSVLELLGVLDYPAAPQLSASAGQVVRAAASRPRINFDLAGQLITNPASALMTRFGLGDPRLPAAQVSDNVFPFIADLGRQVGLQTWYGTPGQTNSTLDPAAAQLIARTFRIIFFDSITGPGGIFLDVAVSLADDGPARVVSVVPTGTLDVQLAEQLWTAEATLTGTVGPIAIEASSVTFTDPSASELTLAISISRPTAADPMLRLGSATGPRFEVGGGSAQITAALSGSGPAVAIAVKLSGVHLVAATGTDSFVSDVVPSGAGATCDLALTWDPHNGLQFNGAPGISAIVPIGLQLGPVSIVCLRAGLTRPSSAAAPVPAALAACLGVDIAVALGPVSATVSNLGIQAQLSTPGAAAQANLGTVDLGVSFKPPDGVGLAIDAGVVSGGGFVAYDPATGRYSGAVELRAESLSLKAIGLLDTRLPDGSPGYSLIVVITADFEPIQLGFGFTLNGIGGLAGINRAVAIDALRTGIKTDQLKNILFPRNPIGNAGQILSEIATIFPPARGNYVFGPMVEIGWGTPTLLTLELAVLLELPPPIKLIVLGRISLYLPDPQTALVRIQMDSLGVVDFGTGQVAVDATLFNSSIVGFTLTGSMALRATWLGQPSFALAIGGFNPAFNPPAQFPALNRVTIALTGGNNPRLRLAAYLAVTSNTAQFGARLDLFAQGPFGITLQGDLYFDALFQFNPFQFVIGVGGSVSIASNGQPILTATVQVTLTGPNGWHVQGSASFGICGVGVTVSFDTTVGSAQPVAAPAPVQLAPMLEAALATGANWTAALPADASTLLTFSAAATAAATVAHPLATLAVHQRVLPLNVSIARFGSATPADPGTFAISAVTIGGVAATALTAVDDWFAPGQFQQLSAADALARPSFEQLQAGVSVTAPPFARDTSPPPSVPAGYVTLVYDVLGAAPREVVLPGPAAAVLAARPASAGSQPASLAGAAVTAPAGSRGRYRYAAPGLALTLAGPRYTLATAATLAAVTAQPGTIAAGSWTAAAQDLAAYLVANPARAGQVQIVAGYEVH